MADFFIDQIIPYQDGKFEVTLKSYMTPEEISVLLLKTDSSANLQPTFGDIQKKIPQEIENAAVVSSLAQDAPAPLGG